MYSPKISEDLIPLIYKKAKEKKKPMTKVVNEIISSWFLSEKVSQTKIIKHDQNTKR